MNLSEIIASVKGGLNQHVKKVLEHHQTVERPRKGTPDWWATVCCTKQNVYKTTQNVDMWEKQTDL